MSENITWVSSDSISKYLSEHPLFRAAVPVEHYKSMPLPTLKLGRPAYAFFTAPASRLRGQPTGIGKPDRVAAVCARTREILFYSRELLGKVPLFGGFPGELVTVSAPSASVAELRQTMADTHRLITAVAPAFFSGTEANGVQRHAALAAVRSILPEPLFPDYEVVAGDFFRWLEQ